MRRILILCLLLLPVTAFAKLKVVTTTTDLAALAREVGGEHVIVTSLCRGDQDPHYLEPKPSYARLLNRADLIIEVGLDLEVGWLPVLLTQSRNPRIQRGTSGHLDASRGVPIMEVPSGKVDRSQGDVHPYGNPHYWLDPRNGHMIAKLIAGRLSQLDPAHAKAYEVNLSNFQHRLDGKIQGWKSRLARLKGKKIVTYHRAFSYFVSWAELNVVEVIEPKPGIPPSPAHILSLIELIKGQNVPLILVENYSNPKPSRELARRTRAKLVNVPTSVQGVATYQELFDLLIHKLEESL